MLLDMRKGLLKLRRKPCYEQINIHSSYIRYDISLGRK